MIEIATFAYGELAMTSDERTKNAQNKNPGCQREFAAASAKAKVETHHGSAVADNNSQWRMWFCSHCSYQ